MAKKKKEEGLKYLQVPLPQANQNAYRSIRLNWGGLNKRETMDTGELSMEKNISSAEAPYLTPSEKRIQYGSYTFPNPISIFGFGDCLFIVNWDKNVPGESFVSPDVSEYSVLPGQQGIYGNIVFYQYGEDSGYLNRDLIFITRLQKKNGAIKRKTRILNNESNPYLMDLEKRKQRNLVQFNVYANEDSPYESDVIRKLLIYPDLMCTQHDFDYSEFFDVSTFDSYNAGVPKLDYATVHLSRVFGVKDGIVFASEYNKYYGYDMDNILDYGERKAWYSTSQSNVKGDGKFTGITAFQGHIVCFKEDFMYEVYNTKNPFRLKDIYQEGCIDNRTIQEVDGTLFFVSRDNVKIYTGGDPRIISYNLGIKEFKNCCSGTDGRNYFLYCENENNQKAIYVFDTYSQKWSQQDISVAVLGFAKTTEGLFVLTKTGEIQKLDTGDYDIDWSFETDTITTLSKARTVDIKHIKKVQMLADFAEGSTLKVYALYDDETFSANTSQLLCDISDKTGRVPVRLLVRKSANRSYKLHFEGHGYVKLYQMEVVTTAGGALDVSGD